MPIEKNFNPSDSDLVLTGQSQVDIFNIYTYVKLSVHRKNGSIVTITENTQNLDAYFSPGDTAIFYHFIHPAGGSVQYP